MESPIIEIDITQLFPDPSQPRKAFSEGAIEALRNDIMANGLREPIDINPLLDGRKTKYLIIDGECRFHAIEGIENFGMVPCRLHTYKSQRQIDKHRASKHFHRKDWNPADRAVWLKYYMTTHKLRQEDLAREFSIKQSVVSEWLAPTRDARVLKALRNSEIGFKQAVLLSRVDGAESRENALSEAIGKTKRETEEIIARAIIEPETPEEIEKGEGELPVNDGEGTTEDALTSPETTGIVAQTLGITVPHEEQEKGTEEDVSLPLEPPISEPESPLPEEGITPDVPSLETKTKDPYPFVAKVVRQFEAVKKLSEGGPRKQMSNLPTEKQNTVIRTSRKIGESWLCYSARGREAVNGESYEMAKLICTEPWVKTLTVEKITSDKEIENAKSSLTQMKNKIDENLNLLAERGG